jgi:hypothetical protein
MKNTIDQVSFVDIPKVHDYRGKLAVISDSFENGTFIICV